MADKRRLQDEIRRCDKKVQEGCDMFDEIWEKFNSASNINQKEKFEADLKKEIKKLQRFRDSIKTWTNTSEIRDKSQLLENRKKIEQRMERFKVVEKETKTKAFSKEGLGAGAKLDPAAREKKEIEAWLRDVISDLELQQEKCEGEIEALTSTGGKKKGKADKKQVEEKSAKLKTQLERHTYHIGQLETLLRMLNNDAVDVKQIKDIQDDVNYYVESNNEEDFEENEYLYDDLNLDEQDTENFSVQPVIGHSDFHDDYHTSSGNSNHHTANHTLSNNSNYSKEDNVSDKVRHRSSTSTSTASSSAATNSSNTEETSKGVSSSTSSSSSKPTVVIPTSKAHNTSLSDSPSVPSSIGSTSVPSTPISSIPSGSVPSSPYPSGLSNANAFSANAGTLAPSGVPSSNLNNTTSTSTTASVPPLQHQISYSNAASAPAANSASPVSDSSNRQNFVTEVRSTSTPPQSSTPNSTTGSSLANSLSNSSMPSPAPSPAAVDVTKPMLSQNSSCLVGNSSSDNGMLVNGAVSKTSDGMVSLQAMAQSAIANQLRQVSDSEQKSLPQQPPQSTSPATSTSSAPSTQTTSIRISPLLGVAPLGPKKLSSENRHQAEMLMAAFHHMPHPSDSERLRHYLPRNPCPTPGYYPQNLPSHGDTIAFFERLSTETLFFIFYYMEGTKAQFFAARALKKQSWRFHTKYMMWFQRHDEPRTITDEYEQGTYIYFDYEKWGQRRKEGFTFEYRFLEDRDLN